eukprot:8553522-Alexandrium_andersonii.AAC.1
MEAIGAAGGRGGKTVPGPPNGLSTRSGGRGPNRSEPSGGAGPSGSSISLQATCSPSSLSFVQRNFLPAGSGFPQGGEPS